MIRNDFWVGLALLAALGAAAWMEYHLWHIEHGEPAEAPERPRAKPPRRPWWKRLLTKRRKPRAPRKRPGASGA